MATFTASEVNALKAVHVGENIVRSHYFGAASVSEVILLARVPNHCIITGMVLSGGTTGVTTGTWSLGFDRTLVDAVTGASLTANSIAAAISLTASGIWVWPVLGGSVAYPLQVSMSDDQNYCWIIASNLGSFTATTTSSLRLLVKYLVPGG